jgi:hypothetical protein
MGSVSPLPTSRAPALMIGEGLRLPLDAATETFGIVGVKGSGKTTTARVLVEELLGHGQQTVVVDPLGVWWGLRADADGKGPGLPVTILGGDHGDLPISPDAGEVLADLAVDEPAPLILDLSALRKGEQRRLMTAFLERLYHRNRAPLHLVVDEADLYMPQRPMRGDERLLGAGEDLVRRGRAKGLGVTLITQRPAVLHKDVLSQVGCLVAHRLVGPQDRAAIDAWVQAHGTREQRDELLAGIASLPTGTAWFWSPAWLDLFAEPAALAPVDLEALQARMAAVVARAEQTDPRALQRRIRELGRELAAARADQPEPERIVERVEVPVLPDELVDRFERALTALTDATAALGKVGTEIAGRLTDFTGSDPVPLTTVVTPKKTAPPRPPAPRPAAPLPAGGDEQDLSRGARGLLEVLARRSPLMLSRAQLATLAGRGVRSSSFAAQLTELRNRGLVEQAVGLLKATDAGLDAAGVADLQPQTSEEVIAMWRHALPDGPRRMLDVLLAAHPGALPRDELARRAGFSPTSSSVGVHLKVLRDNNLAEVDAAQVRASETLFMGGS